MAPQLLKEAAKRSYHQDQRSVMVGMYGIGWFILHPVPNKLIHS